MISHSFILARHFLHAEATCLRILSQEGFLLFYEQTLAKFIQVKIWIDADLQKLVRILHDKSCWTLGSRAGSLHKDGWTRGTKIM